MPKAKTAQAKKKRTTTTKKTTAKKATPSTRRSRDTSASLRDVDLLYPGETLEGVREVSLKHRRGLAEYLRADEKFSDVKQPTLRKRRQADKKGVPLRAPAGHGTSAAIPKHYRTVANIRDGVMSAERKAKAIAGGWNCVPGECAICRKYMQTEDWQHKQSTKMSKYLGGARKGAARKGAAKRPAKKKTAAKRATQKRSAR